MKIFAIVQVEVPDPVPASEPIIVADADPAPNAPKSPETASSTLELGAIGQAIENALLGLASHMAAQKQGFHNARLETLIPEATHLSPVEAWQAIAPAFLGTILKAAPLTPGLLAIPVFTKDQIIEQQAVRLIGMRNSNSVRDMLGFRVDMLSAANNACYAVMKQTEEVLTPIIKIAQAAQAAQLEADNEARQANQAGAPAVGQAMLERTESIVEP